MRSKTAPIGVGVAGLGHVGRETARLLWTRSAQYGSVRLAGVCDRKASVKARGLGLPLSVRRYRCWESLLDDPAVDIIVELFGGEKDARRLVLAALRRGKQVVTANKALISRHGPEIFAAAHRARANVYFEAAVAGGIPILSALRTGLAANRITSAYGIFNGTTNYILSRMAHEGCAMKEALAEAQRLGMAERDPTLDLNGSDTMHKVSIVAALLSGGIIPPRTVAREGIEGIEAEDMRYVIEHLRHTIRLVGTVGISWDKRPLRVEAHVQPTLLDLRHPLAAVHGAYNAVLVETSSAGNLMFYGAGAGPGPAASAVVGDILALARDRTTRDCAPEKDRPVLMTAECDAAFYLKLNVRDVPGALSRITGILGRNDISIAAIDQPGRSAAGKHVPVMIKTHKTSRARMNRARIAITHLVSVGRRHTCLRFLPETR